MKEDLSKFLFNLIFLLKSLFLVGEKRNHIYIKPKKEIKKNALVKLAIILFGFNFQV